MNNYQLKSSLYQHQLECLKYSETHDKFLLADEMGLGKTLQAIAIACANKKEGQHCLILCGVNGLKWNWREEVLKHSYEEPFILGERKKKNKIVIGNTQARVDDLNNIDNLPYFIITNIESLRQKVKTGNKVRKRVNRKMKMVDEYVYPVTDKLVELCENGRISCVIADECHKMKNPESEQGQQFLRLQTPLKVAMTGTPIMNSPLDLFIILKWLGYEEHSYWQFKTHYCQLGGYGGYEVVGYKNLPQLTRTLDKMMLRRLKNEVIDLPEKIYMTEYVEMGAEQSKVYRDVHKEISSNIDKIAQSNNPLSQLIRLRQATGYTGILSSKIKESAKLDRMEELVDNLIAEGEKVVIFSNWTSITDEVVKRLTKYHPLVITGETKDDERQSYIHSFQEDKHCKVIVGTIGAMGTGVTLTAGRSVIFLDEPWNMALRQQAEDRVYRIGQNKAVNIYFLLTKNTIDERIHSLVEEKGAMSDAIVDKAELVNYLIS